MSLTIGRAPFGRQRAGHFDFEVPATVTYVEPFPRRVRGMKGGATVVDSDRVLLVFRTGTIPHWAFLPEDVTIDARPDTAAPGYVRVEWDAADEWWEEDERVFVHVRDPYTRVDCYPTSRHVRVTVGDTVVAESTRAVALYETGLPTLLLRAGLLSKRMVDGSNFCAASCSVPTVRCVVCMVLVRGPPRVLGATTGSTSVSELASPSTSRSSRKL